MRPVPPLARICGLVGGLLAASAARAAPPAGLRLEWRAPPGCPDAAQVRDMAERVLGRAIDPAGAPTTSVEARVVATDGGFALTIETRSAGGTDRRQMQDPRCSVLAEATAVIAATAVDPSRTPPLRDEPVLGDMSARTDAGIVPPAPPGGTGVVAPTGTGAAAPGGTGAAASGTGAAAPRGTGAAAPAGTGAAASGTGAAPSEGAAAPAGTGARRSAGPGAGRGELSPRTGDARSELSPGTGDVRGERAPGPGDERAAQTARRDLSSGTARRARLRGALRLAGVGDLGSAPGVTGGLAVAGALLGPRWRAELSGLWLAPRTAVPDPTLDLGASVGLLALALRGCGVPRVRRLEIPVCGGLEAGALRGRGVGTGLGTAARDVVPWVALSAGPGLAFAPVPRLALTLQVDLVVPLLTPRFVVGGYDGDVYRGSPAAGRAALGIEVRFR